LHNVVVFMKFVFFCFIRCYVVIYYWYY